MAFKTRSHMPLRIISALILLVLLTLPALGAPQINYFTLLDISPVDIVGTGSFLQPDGKPDATFQLYMRGVGIISRIRVRNLSTGKLWDTQISENSNVLLVQDDKGKILNGKDNIPKLLFFFSIKLNLWLNDIRTILSSDAEYQVTVTFIDNSTLKSTAKVKKKVFSQTNVSGVQGHILFAQSAQQDTIDLVGPGKELAPNGVNDWHIVTRIQAKGIITGFRITNTVGGKGDWDTLPASESSAPLIAVTDSDKKLIRGPIEIPIKGTRTFHLYLENNGTLGQDSTRSQLIVSMADGRIFDHAINFSSQSLYDIKIVSADYLGVSQYDYVNASTRPGYNLNPDLRIDVTLQGTGALTGVQVQNMENPSEVWDTDPQSPNWLVGVTQNGSGLQNKSNGALQLPLKGSNLLSLWIERKTPHPNSRRYKVTLTWEDGSSTETETEPQVLPAAPEEKK